jgi:hypothetical protein
MTQLEQVDVDTARRLAKVGRTLTRQRQRDDEFEDALLRTLESRGPRAKRIQRRIREIAK